MELKSEPVSEPTTPQESIPTTVSRISFSDIIYKQGAFSITNQPIPQIRENEIYQLFQKNRNYITIFK